MFEEFMEAEGGAYQAARTPERLAGA
jgi:hypothetical protein